MEAIEHLILHFFNLTVRNRHLDVFFAYVTVLGSLEVLIVICLVIFLFGKRHTKGICLGAVFSLLATRFFVTTIKQLVNRPRSYMVFEDVQPFWDVSSSSFPSGHAALAFAFCIALAPAFKRWRWLLLAVALSVAISRLYMGVHYITDVVAGALIGSLISFGIMRIKRTLVKDVQN